MVLTTRVHVLLVALIAPSAAYSWWRSLKINCGVSLWSEWSDNADGITRTRTRDIYRNPRNGGARCPAVTQTEIERRTDAKSAKEVVILTDGRWNCAGDNTISNLVGKLKSVSTTLDAAAKEVAVFAFVIGKSDDRVYQSKIESILTEPIENHLFPLINMIIFDETIEAIQEFNRVTPSRCVALDT